MAKEFHDGIAQAVTVTGTGNATLATAAYTARRTLQSVASAGAVVSYRIAAVDANGSETGEWETGEGTYLGSNAFQRTTPDAGSGSLPVNFSSGTKKFTLTPNAADLRVLGALTGGMSVTRDGTGRITAVTANGTTYTLTYATIAGKTRWTGVTGGGSSTTINYNADGTFASVS